MSNEVAKLREKLEGHIKFYIKFQETQAGYNERSTAERETIRLSMVTLKSEIKDDMHAAFRLHEQVESDMAVKASERTERALDRLADKIEKNKDNKANTDTKVLIWIIGLLVTSVSVLLWDVLSNG